nr:hypothetical protein [Tanacetum cinerariifolium]
MLNNDSSIIIPSKIDSLFDEFAGELTLLKSIPSGIDETDCHPEEETHFTKRLLYDNSSPHPPEEFVSDNSNADIKFFSSSPIPIKDSDSHMEEIDLSLCPVEPKSRDFTMDVVEDISPTKEPQSLECIPDDDQWKEQSSLGCSFVPFLSPLIRLSMGGIWSSSFDLKQALRGRHPVLIFFRNFLFISIPGFMKILANGFHYLKSLLSPLFNLGIMYPDLTD